MHPHTALATLFQADPPQNPQKSRIEVPSARASALFCRSGGDRGATFSRSRDRETAGFAH
jgi:hypothetical protein